MEGHAPAAEHGAQLLYIHPRGHLNDLVVPAGALSCLNAVTAPKLGRYAFEVSEAELRAAAVVAVDFHWAVSLPGLERLLAHVRRVRPDVPVIVGGISAGHYASELTRAGTADYVLRGDSEEPFAALVGALLDHRPAGAIANVVGRDGPLAPPRRASAEAFDATDPLTADWFPTLAKVRDWDARAFPAGPNIPIARGCPMRCPTCYGSYADTFGPGWLLRSPTSTAALVLRAEALGARNFRLLLGKPGAAAVSAQASALASAGPFRFEGSVGLYLCTPPPAEVVEALLAAFQGEVVISAVSPYEHAPALAPEQLAAEMDGWREVSRRASTSRGRLRLDLWASTAAGRDEVRRVLGGGSPSLGVSLSAVWHLTRPMAGSRPTLDALRDAVQPLWTFYAARLLSPALAGILEPFRLLDELDEPPETIASRPTGALAAWYDVILSHWGAHRLPLLPGLVFSVVPVSRNTDAPLWRGRAGAWFRGDVGLARPGSFTLLGSAPVRLDASEDYSGVRLRSVSPLPPGGDGYALVPYPPGARNLASSWLREIATHGLVVVPSVLPPREVGLQVTLRVQEAEVALLGADGAPVRRGRADLDYTRPPRDRRDERR